METHESAVSGQFIARDHDHQQCVRQALSNAEQVCQQQGGRFTVLRRRVFELIWQQHKPIGAYQVLEQLQEGGRAAPPTVYRALDFLLRLGLIHRIVSLNAYVGCHQPGSAHQGQFLICQSCRHFAELDSSQITTAVEQNAAASGFQAQRHTIEIMGLCPQCRHAGDGP